MIFWRSHAALDGLRCSGIAVHCTADGLIDILGQQFKHRSIELSFDGDTPPNLWIRIKGETLQNDKGNALVMRNPNAHVAIAIDYFVPDF